MRLKKSAGIVVSTMAAVSMLAVCIPAAQAAPRTAHAVALPASTGMTVPESLRNSINALDPYVTATDSGWFLHAPAAVLAAVPAQDLTILKRNIEQSNQLIRSGALKRVDSVSANGTRTPEWRVSGPGGYVESHWYGYKIHLYGWLVNKLEGGLSTVGGIAALITFLGGGPATGLIAAISGIIVGEMMVCAKGNGDVDLYYVGGFPPAGALVCNPL